MAIVTEAFKNTYRRNFMPIAQQRVSKLLPYVDVVTGIEKVAGEKHFIDQVLKRTVQQDTERAGDSPHTAQDYARRMMTMTSWHDGLVLDSKDTFKTLDDPTNAVVREQRKAFARKIDNVIISEIAGTAYSGHAGGSSNTLSGNQTIAATYNETGSTSRNLTVAKIRRASEVFGLNEADDGGAYFVASPNQRHALLMDDEVTSADYNNVRALVNGEVDSFMGFKFIWHNDLSIDSSSLRSCIAWTEGAFTLGFAKMPTAEMDPSRSDKKFMPYVYIAMTFGGVRLEEERVITIACDETTFALG